MECDHALHDSFSFHGAISTDSCSQSHRSRAIYITGYERNTSCLLGVRLRWRFGLGFTDKSGQGRITLGVEPDGYPSFDLRGKNGTRRFIMFVKGDDSPELSLFDNREKRRVGLIVDGKIGSAGLLVSDTAERKRGGFLVGGDGLVGLTLMNTREQPLIAIGEFKTGPVLSMTDNKKIYG